MSDSDDTDVLLLIPPNIFAESVERDLELNSFQTEVVGNLIFELNKLENRVSLIESISSSCGNNSMIFNDCEVVGETSAVVNEELTHNEDLVSPSCTLNACEINSNTESSLDLNHSENGCRSKSKETLLKEIDSYLSNLGSKSSKEERIGQNYDISLNSSEKSNHTMDDISVRRTPPYKRLDLPEVDRLLKEMEATQTEIENKLRSRELEYGLGGQRSFQTYRKSFPLSEDRNNSNQERNSAPFLPLTSPLNLHELDRQKQQEDFQKKRDTYLVGSSQNSDSDDTRKNAYDIPNVGGRDLKTSSSFDSKKRFVSPRRRLFAQPDSLLSRKPASGKSSSSNNTNIGSDLQSKDYLSQLGSGDNSFTKPIGRATEMTAQRDKLPFKYSRNDLLSLAELWKSERDLSDDDSKKLRQKLEEEKIRRIHLENTIQDLQRRVLEEQEKLAVAVKVDEGKDKAIAQITEAWKQMVNHWKEIEADRYAMSQSIIKERSSIKQIQEDINKKVERWEKEVSQALDLAAGFKSKCEFLENELSVTLEANNERTSELENKLKTAEEQLQEVNEERKILTDKLKLSEDDHSKEKHLVELAQKELSALQETLKKSETELLIVKEQRDLLSSRLRDEKGRNTTLDQQKASLQQALDETKIQLNEAEETIKNNAANLDRMNSEVRAVYQKQLEAVVKEKLDEFQSQLDKAQAAMKAELNETRRLAQERASAQQQELVNSHILEIRRLESMYKENIKSLETKLAESERRRGKLELGKKEIVRQLHGVMEAQWQKALSILTSEVSMRQVEPDLNKVKDRDSNEIKAMKTVPTELETSVDEPSICKDVHPKQDTLLKYINMLLDKQPGKPIDSGSSVNWPELTQSDTLDDSIVEHKWNQLIPSASIPENLRPGPLGHKKPPWK